MNRFLMRPYEELCIAYFKLLDIKKIAGRAKEEWILHQEYISPHAEYDGSQWLRQFN